MTTHVLVHGGWHGAWCWDLVGAELTARGHRVIAVDLPAGDPTAGAAEYAEVVLAALATPVFPRTTLPRQPEQSPTDAGDTLPPRQPEQSPTRAGEDLVLVGHSLAGLTVPLVAERRPVRHLVLLAAMLPEPGRSVDDRARAGERQTRRGLGRNLTAHADGSSSWDPAAAETWLYPDSPPERARAAAARLRPQHFRVTAEPSPLTAWPDVPATYVLCQDDQVIDTEWARTAAARLPRTELFEMPGDHSPFLSRPSFLADWLGTLR